MVFDNDFINNNSLVPNPLYKKGKKNTQPKFITSYNAGTRPTDSGASSVFFGNFGQASVQLDDAPLEALQDYGITANRYTDDYRKQLAEEQSTFKKFGNAIAQAVISEGALAIAKGFSDLFDVATGAIFRSNNDYSNPVSQYLESLQEDFRNNVAPIYADPDKTMATGGLTDAGWWASNLPSIITSLSLMVPSTAVVKGVSWLGKGLNLLSKGKLASFCRNTYKVLTGASKAKTVEEAAKLNKVTRWLNDSNTITAAQRMAETGFNAALMRTMENYQESRQVYSDMKTQVLDKVNSMSDAEYNNFINTHQEELEGVDVNDKEAVAHSIAKSSADRTFLMDYANIMFDVIQLNALRNPAKLLKNMRSSASITSAQQASTKAIGKAAVEAATASSENVPKAALIKRLGKGAGRFIKNSGYTLKAEGSEGIEEAINYIAQEEGMHYGNVILGEDIDNGFMARLGSYALSPELYDAAFWGVLGGVVFQGLGSGINRLQTAAVRKYQQNKKKGDSKTGEATNTESWQELFETSENKRRIADINARQTDFETLTSRLKQIEEQSTDPFNEDENGRPLTLNTEVEKTAAKEKAISQYITNMTFRAMDNGNFDMLKAYLQDANVRQALEEVTGNEGDGGAFIDSLVNRMDEISKRYSQNLIALTNLSRDLNIAGDSNIPIEYLQIIARDNTHNQLRIEDINAQIANYETSIENRKSIYGDKLDKSLDYKDAVQFVVLTQQLAQLKARREELTQDKTKQGIGRQIELDKIDENIKVIENMITGQGALSNSDALTRLLYAHIQSNFINKSEDYDKNLIDLAAGNISAILGEERAKDFETSDEELMKVLGEDRSSGAYAVLAGDINAAFEGAYGLNNIDSRFGDDYASLAALNIEKAFLNQNTAMNVSSVNKRVNELHNSMLDSRRKAINKAADILKSLARTYGRETIANNLDSGDEIAWNNENDKKQFDDALEILNLTSPSNTQLYTDIQNMLALDELTRLSQEAANPTEDESGENSSTSENANSANQNEDLNNQSQTQTETEEPQETTLNQREKDNEELVNRLLSDIDATDVANTDIDSLRGLDDRAMAIISDTKVSKELRNKVANSRKKIIDEINKRNAATSSTGGQEKTSKTNNVDDNGQPIPDAQREAVKREISKTLIDAVKTAGNNNEDVTEALNKAVKELNDKYGNDDEFKNEINRISRSLALRAQKKGWISDVANIVVLASSIEERGGKYQFIDDFTDAIKAFVDKFLKASNAKQFNGKTVVSFESILRFANEQMEDSTTAQYIYKMMKAWFEDERNAKNYIVLDNMDSTSIFDRAAKSNRQLAQERTGGTNVFRVNIYQHIEYVNSKKAFDALNVGDTLTAKLKNGNIILMSNGVEIGTLPKPEIDATTGAFKKTNNGWITDVRLDNGEPYSELRKVWEDILLNNTPINDKINSFIYQIIAAKKTGTDINGIIKNINEDKDLTDFFDNLKTKGLVDEKASNEQLINGLVSIWDYIDLTNPIAEEREADIKYSLDLWFNKLYDTYATINNIGVVDTKGLVFRISKITDGDVIQVAPNDKQGYDKCTLGKDNEAFANVETTEIGVIKSGNSGVIQTTTNKQVPQPAGSTGSIWAILPNRSGIPGIVRGHMVRFTDRDANINNTAAGRIRQAIAKEFERRIKEFVNNGDFDGLSQFIDLVIGNRISTPLLASIGGGTANVKIYKDATKGDRIVIGIKKSDGTFVNFTINSDTRQYSFISKNFKDADNVDEFIKDFKEQILANCCFNAAFAYFNSDSDTSTPLDGLATRDKNGNFVITIPNGTDNPLVETFPSFKHFMMQGGAARWNTKNVNGSNFQPKSQTSQLRNQILNVAIENKSSRPVEGNEDTQITPEQIESGEAIDNLINRVFKENAEYIKRLQKLGLIPKSVKYTSTITVKGGNPVRAEYSISKKQIYVNDRWIELAKTDPERALRILIHERIHEKLRERGNRRRELINRIREIRDEFKASFDKLTEEDKKELREKYNISNVEHTKGYAFDNLGNEEEALEEFLVESLTNRELASYLNFVKTDVPGTKTKQSIFDKILKLLAEIFDWKIESGSLYEKEFKVLQGLTNEVQQEQTNQPTYKEGNIEFKEDTQEEKVIEKEEKPIKENKGRRRFGRDDRVGSSMNEVVNTPKYSAEMQAIKERAIADGTFMKAPNGKPTNLTERQWLQVRTKNFINWFGDWINDPANASKVVDENGEPLVVYHGSSAIIEKFDKSKNTKGYWETPNGERIPYDTENTFFFSDNKASARAYPLMRQMTGAMISNTGIRHINELQNAKKAANRITEDLIVDSKYAEIIRKALDTYLYKADEFRNKTRKLGTLTIHKGKIAFQDYGIDGYEYKDVPAEYINDAIGAINITLDSELAYYNRDREDWDGNKIPKIDLDKDVYPVFLNLKNPFTFDYEGKPTNGKYKDKYPIQYINARQVKKALENGNDGVLYLNIADPYLMNSYGVFNSNQIKSATDNNGEFSTEDNSILASSMDEVVTPPVTQFVESLPLDKQVKFGHLIQDGTISTKCS